MELDMKKIKKIINFIISVVQKFLLCFFLIVVYFFLLFFTRLMTFFSANPKYRSLKINFDDDSYWEKREVVFCDKSNNDFCEQS